MNKTYWIVRYPAKGNRHALPIPCTLRSTRFESLNAAAKWGLDDWSKLKKEHGFECVKVQLIEPVAAPYIAKL